MKKILSLALALVMVLSLAAALCGCSDDTKSDVELIKKNGKLVIGITEFEPMDYQNADGKWIGFDADTASAFAKSLGVEAEFKIIDWDSKIMELDAKNIDCVWNGMTLDDAIKAAMSTSKPYFNNAQVVIVAADKADQYKTAEDCKDLKFAVEGGSAGMNVAKENGFTYTEVQDQASALMEVASGTSDAAIIDFLMAVASVGEGTAYSNLTYAASLSTEEYGVGFRKDSDLTAKLNEFFAENAKNGELKKIADKYGIGEYLITDYEG